MNSDRVMDRRTFIGSLAGGLLAVPLAAEAQQAGKVWRVGSLSTGVSTGSNIRPLLSEGLQALGYVEGSFILELRYAEGRVDRLPALAAELVQLNVDVIVAWGGEPLAAVRQAASRIPIVMVARGDPVAIGLVASLAKPGGKHHRDDHRGPRTRREAAGASQGGPAGALSRGRSAGPDLRAGHRARDGVRRPRSESSHTGVHGARSRRASRFSPAVRDRAVRMVGRTARSASPAVPSALAW